MAYSFIYFVFIGASWLEYIPINMDISGASIHPTYNLPIM